jgi:hypothetical protein
MPVLVVVAILVELEVLVGVAVEELLAVATVVGELRIVKNILECFTRVVLSVDATFVAYGFTHDILAVTLFEPSLINGGAREYVHVE